MEKPVTKLMENPNLLHLNYTYHRKPSTWLFV